MLRLRSFPISIDFPVYQEVRGGPHLRTSDELMMEIMRGVLAGYGSLTDEAKLRVRSIKIKVHTYGHEGQTPKAPEGVERFDYEARITYSPTDGSFTENKENMLVAEARAYYVNADPQKELWERIADLVRDTLHLMLEEYVLELQATLRSTERALLPPLAS